MPSHARADRQARFIVHRLTGLTHCLAAVALLAVSACDRPLAPVESPTYVVGSPPHNTAADEFGTVPRFSLEVEIVGALIPGAPIDVRIRAQALISTAAASIRIVSPEGESAKANAWSPGPPHEIGQRLPRLGEWERALAQGEVFETNLTVRFEAPGYYRLSATARNISTQAPLGEGRSVQEFVHREVWLLVTERGGVATTRFDPSVFPPDVQRIPGVFRHRSAYSDSGSQPTDARPMEASSLTQTTKYLALQYYDAEFETYDFVEGAHVEFWQEEVPGGSILGGSAGITDGHGLLQVGCPNSNDYMIRGTVDLLDEISWVISGQVAFEIWDCSGDLYHYLFIDGANVRLWRDLGASGRMSRQVFERQRARVTAELGGGRYDSSSDHIYGGAGYGEFEGRFIAAHEYGHAFHHKSLGGISPIGPDCDPHTFSSYEIGSCALAEGFADYHALVTLGSAGLPTYYPGFENNIWWPNNLNNDGARSEGPIASFLLDLTDPANESHDSVQYPGRYIADVIRTCRARYGPFWVDRSNIGEITYCLEQRVDSAVTASPTYFPTFDDPSEIVEGATEPASWNAGSIRLLWRTNLYGGL